MTTLTTEAASAQTDAPVAAVPLVARPPRPALDHTVQPGDDLWSLAERYYGEGTGWHAIVEANPHLAGDTLAELAPGTISRPSADAHGAHANSTTIADSASSTGPSPRTASSGTPT